MLMPVKLNSFAHLRALSVLHDRGILPPTQQAASLGTIPPPKVTQILVLRLGYCDSKP
jgi:hypothetical protein